MALIEALSEYADRLQSSGFTVYEPASGSGTYFLYSREVSGKECFGYVQYDRLGVYSHSMPIRPSKEHGSSMFVDGVPDELTVDSATRVASPVNVNHLVGCHENYEDPDWLARGYVRRR